MRFAKPIRFLFCRCQPVTTVRKPVSSQSPSSPEFRSMKTVSFAMLKAEKAGLWQTPQTWCQEDSWLLMLLCYGFQESSGIMLPVPVQSRNEQSIEQLLPCQKNTSTCASSITCHSCQFMWRSCRESVHINHQHRTESTRTRAGISSFTIGQINEECLLRNVES